MSRTVDERVVEMRFDNKEFERNAKDTMTVLQRLKESLNMSDAAKNFDLIDKASRDVRLDGLAAGVEALQNRFSTFGIVGMRVIENITDALMSKLSTAVGFVQNSIISGGIKRAMNIENAHFQLQALLKDEELVQEYMSAANESVTGTAYAYDEAAKAASMFAASGVQAGDEVMTALRGLVGVASMTSSDYESISRIFTTVAGNGRLMGDQLLQLSSRGMNAAATIAEYLRKIRNDASITESDVRAMVSDGAISFEIFANAMNDAFGDAAFRANETFTGAFSNMKAALARIGAGFFSPLVEQNSEVVNLFNVLKDRINDVKKALVFDESLGNMNALSKQFTDTVLTISKSVATFLETADLSKPMEIFYYGLESIKNVVKGLYSVLKPVAKAFDETFFSFSIDNLVKLAETIEDITSKMKLSEKNSKNLHDTFKGVFDIAKLLVKIFVSLVKVVVPINKPIGTLSESLLELTGALGRTLTNFAEWVNRSPKIARAYTILRDSVRSAMNALSKFIKGISNFVKTVYQLPATQKIISGIMEVFDRLGTIAAPYIDLLMNKVEEFKGKMAEFIPQKANDLVDSFLAKLNIFLDTLSKFDIDNAINSVKKLIDNFKGASDTMGNGGFDGFVDGVLYFSKNLKEAFSFDNLFKNIEGFEDHVGGFLDWIQNKITPIFSGFNIASSLAATGGIGLIYSLVKVSKAFESVAKSFTSVTGVFKGINGVLKEYQNSLKADTLKKVAVAIAILAGSILLLSFADTDKVYASATALSIIAGVLLFGVTKLLEVIKQGQSLEEGLSSLAKNLGKGFKKLTTGIKWKLIGSAVKNLGLTLLMIVGSIAAIWFMYRKDASSFEAAIDAVGKIATVLVAIVFAFSLPVDTVKKGSTDFLKIAGSVLILTLALSSIISSLGRLFKMKMPEDYRTRLGILAGLILGLAVLCVTMAGAGRLAGNNTFDTKPLLSMAASLYLIILSMDKLFKMTLPEDYGIKLLILVGIMYALGSVMVALSYVSKKGQTTIKAGGTILAMAVFLGAVVAALFVLTLVPADKMLSGALAIGAVLIALGGSLYLAGKATTGINYKSILNMAIAVGVITAAITVLALIKPEKMIAPVIALGAILGILAIDFNYISKINTNNADRLVGAMVLVIGVLAIALYNLAKQPWQGMLLSTIALSSVLLVLTQVFKTISNLKSVRKDRILNFATLTTSLIPIAISLYALARFPWSNLLGAAGAISLTLGALIGTFAVLQKVKNVNKNVLINFGILTLALIPVCIALSAMARYSWDSLLGASAAMSLTLIALSTVFGIIGNVKPDMTSIGSFVIAVIAVAAIGEVLKEMARYDWQNLIGAATSLTIVLLGLSATMAIASLVGKAAGPAALGLVILEAFIATLALLIYEIGKLTNSEEAREFIANGAEVLAQIGLALGNFFGNIIGGAIESVASTIPFLGQCLSDFWDNAQPFFDGIKGIGEDHVKGVLMMAAMILALTEASILEGIASFLSFGNGGIVAFGEKLADFAEVFVEYCQIISDAGIDGATVEAASNAGLALASMVKALPGEGGFLEKITGTKSLTEFGEQLVAFAPNLVEFAEKTKDITPGMVEGAAQATELMSNLAKGLPNDGGWIATVFGENNIDKFGEQLLSFGQSLAEFVPYVEGISESQVTGAANATELMVDLANKLQGHGGIWQDLFGEKSLDDFGSQLVRFGKYMQEFVPYVEDISEDQVSGAAAAGMAMAQLYDALPKSDGVIQDIFGEKDMSTFGEQLKSFGRSFAQFVEYVKDVKTDSLDGVLSATGTLITMTADLNKTGGVFEFFTGSNDIGTFGTNLKTFGDGFYYFYESIEDVNIEQLSGVIGEIGKLITLAADANGLDVSGLAGFGVAIQSLAYTGLTALIEAFEKSYETVEEAVSELCECIVDTFDDGLPHLDFNTIGLETMDSLKEGMESKKETLTSSSYNLATVIISTFNTRLQKSTFILIGENIALGLKTGIINKTNEVAQAAIASAQQIIDSMKSTLQIYSPSRIAFGIGEFWDIGLANGIISKNSEIRDSSIKVSNTVIDTFGNMIQAISTLMDEDIDLSPTIVPVLDLSNLDKEAKEIGSYFDNGFAISTYNNAMATASTVRQTKISKEQEEEESQAQVRRWNDLIGKLADEDFGNTFQNTFNIQSNDPEEVADVVSRRIQKQVERKKKVWA